MTPSPNKRLSPDARPRCSLRLGRKLRRFLLPLIILGSGLGAAISGEPALLAYLRPVPKVAPAQPAPPVAPVTPAAPSPRPSAAASDEELHPARRAIELNPIYDESSPEFLRLQRMDEATRHMKRDAVGFPDWMASLRSGAIAPRAGLSATDNMKILDLDVIMKNTKEMPYVRFPHQAHTLWLDCSNCHPTPFLPKTGANPVSMSSIFSGNYCGMCHDRVAFITFFACNRCHSVPQDAASQKP